MAGAGHGGCAARKDDKGDQHRRRVQLSGGTRPPQLRQRWSIAVYFGTSPLDLRPAPGDETPALTGGHVTDFEAEFVADPFLVYHDSQWHLLFEAMDARTVRGVIALATSPDARQWTYRQTVLAEPFHLSYPYVFAHAGEYFMIPETAAAGHVRLYRADPFPIRWTFECALLNRGFTDPSIVQWEGKWWIVCGQGGNDSSSLFYSDELCGPWIAHPQNPIVRGNIHHARPAGRIIQWDAQLLRFAQDCHPDYGTRVWPFRITTLSTTDYAEELAGPQVLGPGDQVWNRAGMHHVDAHPTGTGRWLAAVDGWYEAPESRQA